MKFNGKVYVHMLCFNNPTMIRGALENFRDTVEDDPRIVKVMFEIGYPLPSPDETKAAIIALAAEFGWGLHSMENKGVAGNWTQAFDYFKPSDEDVIIGFDPDCRMRPKGWLPAIAEVNAAHPEAPCVIPNRDYRDEEWCWKGHGREKFIDEKTGYQLGRYKQLVAWSLGTHRCDWLNLLRKEGEFKAYAPFYAWSEHWQYDQLKKHGKDWLELCDFYDDHQGSEELYSKWKVASAKNETVKRFEEWLKEDQK